jgi:hypothetical protein
LVKVIVHPFEVWEIGPSDYVTSRRMGTIERIGKIERSRMIEGAGVEIETSRLDAKEDGLTPIGFGA